MNYKEITINRSYISCGDDNIATAFLNPTLKCTKIYKRSVGFFSSGVLQPIMDGIVALARHNGKIQLIASPKLNEEDIAAINTGYSKRENIINDAFTRDFINEIETYEDSNLQLLVELISRGILDIKIAVTETLGEYHDKLGILEDFEGNILVFYGSPNSSINGYRHNYEKIRVVKSWIESDNDSIEDEIREFDGLWDGTNPFVTVYEYKDCARKNLLEVMERKKTKNANNSPIELREYQRQAIEAWENNNYHGFYVMATGTGKTWTAIYSAKKLIEEHKSMVVICAPYKHLVKQWAEDVEKAFKGAKTILVSSENYNWEQQISQAIIMQKYNPNTQIIIISTIASFNMERFNDVLKKSTEEKLLIVDEAHRFTNRDDSTKEMFDYMLGLSATPFSGSSAQRGLELMNYFGGQVFSLTIEEALERKFLVPYEYHPIYVYATDEEEQKFQYHTQRIISCFKNNKLINQDLLVKSLRNRLRVISMASGKIENVDEIINEISEKDHFVVYCGDGKLFDYDYNDEIRHIQSIKKVLSNYGIKSSQFTAKENMTERMQLVDAFNKGEISALAAIRCLDEGINIPSIKSALILSSNDDYREFVQRRGRILRPYKGKTSAKIYDVIVLPSADLSSWAKIEFRRYYEYAKLALNYDELQKDLDAHLNNYNLSMDDIDVYDYEDMEEPLDE